MKLVFHDEKMVEQIGLQNWMKKMDEKSG